MRRLLDLSRVHFLVVMFVLSFSSGAAWAAACQSSSLTGFTSSVDLSGNGLVLHWAALDSGAQTALQMALEAKAGSGAESGWISAGWSADGRMYPADCVIGNMPGGSMGAYYMSGYGDADVAPTSSFALSSAEMLTSNGGTIMKFSRVSGDGGAVPVNVAGVNTVIWAYSQSGSTALGFHGRNDGATSVDFSCVGAAAAAAGNSTAGSNAGGSTGGNTTTGSGSGGTSGSINSTTGSGTGSGTGSSSNGTGSGSTTNSTTPAPPSTPPAYNESLPFPPDSNGSVSGPPHDEGGHEHGNEQGDEHEHGNDGEQEGGEWGDGEEWEQWGSGEGEREGEGGDGGDRGDRGEGGAGDEGGEGGGGGTGRGGGSGAASACQASSLAGYEHSVTLTNGLLLHWTLVNGTTTTNSSSTSTPTTSTASSTSSASSSSDSTGGKAQLRLALEAQQGSGAESGWISIGWSTNGRMAPADAVIGNLPGSEVAAYAMTGYQMSDVTVTSRFSVTEASTEAASNGATVVKFTRTEGDGGVVPVDFSGVNTLVWAFSGSGSQALDFHNRNDGSVQVDFTCSTAATGNNTSASTQGGDSQSLGATSAAASSSGSSSSSACTASSLAGYECMVQLSGDNFILHWTTNSTNTIALAAEAATSGWVSVGWSPSGRMYPAEAAIGNLPAGTLSTGAAAAVGAYSMTGYGASDVAVTSSFAVTDAAVEAGNGRTVIKFERSMNDGDFPVSSSRVLWAYARDNSQQLADHGPNAGSATINFATGASEVGEGSTESATLYTVHAWLLTVAFGMLMPSAILISRLFLADKPMPVHSTAPGAASNPGASNSTAAGAATAAAGGLGEPMLGEKHSGAAAAEGGGSPLKGSLPSSLVAEDAPALVALSVGGPPAAAAAGAAGSGRARGAAATGGAVSKKPWLSKPMAFEVHKWLMLSAVLLALAGIIMAFVEKGSQSLQSTHGQLGLAVMVLIVVQPIVGHLRPLKKHPGRPSWFVLHWVIGVGTVAIAWANTYLGFDLATSKFGYDLDWSYIAFSILIGLFCAVYVFDFVLDQVGFCCASFEKDEPHVPTKTVEIV
ncbi:unnamed protein product [Closterium sp. Naga37s-1]|nr:unnamed protein product [Closterium sp. Naga37s-1]